MNSGHTSTAPADKSVFICAGEQSGDLHASGLINELRKLTSGINLNINGIGGKLLKNEGVNLLYHIKDLSTIGYLDVVKKYGFFKKVLNECSEFIKHNNPAVIILVDYPGFNIRLAERIRSYYKGKIIYYISPQLWAWNKKRVYKIKKYVDEMLVVFPFEVDFYKSFGVEAIYVGHPLVKRIKLFLEQNKKQSDSPSKQKIITILPGSRNDEIRNHLPVLIKTASSLKDEYKAEINFSIAPGIGQDTYNRFSSSLKKFNLIRENVYSTVLNSDLVLTKAGTSTIECSLIGTPFLVFYRTLPVNYYLLKPIVNVDKLGMVNILAKENIVKEFIQKDFTVPNLLNESRKILKDESYRTSLQQRLKKIWDILGNEDASLNAAKIVMSNLNLINA
jgi:lipid-A-disaccharide synthase